MATEDIEFACQAVATERTAKEAARAMIRQTVRRRGLWVFCGVFLAVSALLTAAGGDHEDVGTGSIIVSAIIVGLLVAAVLFVTVLLMAYGVNRRTMDQAFGPGEVFRTGFGEEEFVIETPRATTRRPYDAVRTVSSDDQFVFVQYKGEPMTRVFLIELFPPSALQRLIDATGRT